MLQSHLRVAKEEEQEQKEEFKYVIKEGNLEIIERMRQRGKVGGRDGAREERE